MERFVGKSVCSKIAMGKIYVYDKQAVTVSKETDKTPEEEIALFQKAVLDAQTQLQVLYDKALREVGEAESGIFEIHSMMLEDENYCDSVHHMIRTQKANAAYAVSVTGENFAAMFAEMDDDYMRARAADVKDISERVVSLLLGRENGMSHLDEPVILVAEDLAPSETVQMEKSKLLGFAIRYGSLNSHTAILARTMNIPALIGVDIQKSWHGKYGILDGREGRLIVDPDEETRLAYEKLQEDERRKEELLKQLKGQKTISKDGQEVQLYANIGSISDTAAALTNDAEGIGLFRSEFLYLEATNFPTEEEQFYAYKTVAENMAGKKVIIRTLDLGADKQVGYFDLGKEENPAMGYRAIRICLTRPDIFKTQLKAIYQASAYGTIAVMLPMITSVEEILQAKTIIQDVKDELAMENIPFQDVEFGCMIETPAAVMISDLLAREVDFFSVGTNDLSQYTMAIDRQNAQLDAFFNPHHKAVLRMLKLLTDHAHQAGKWVGICGELAADLDLTEFFLAIGVDELSVAPNQILPVREKIRSLDLSGERERILSAFLDL